MLQKREWCILCHKQFDFYDSFSKTLCEIDLSKANILVGGSNDQFRNLPIVFIDHVASSDELRRLLKKPYDLILEVNFDKIKPDTKNILYKGQNAQNLGQVFEWTNLLREEVRFDVVEEYKNELKKEGLDFFLESDFHSDYNRKNSVAYDPLNDFLQYYDHLLTEKEREKYSDLIHVKPIDFMQFIIVKRFRMLSY